MSWLTSYSLAWFGFGIGLIAVVFAILSGQTWALIFTSVCFGFTCGIIFSILTSPYR